MNKFNNEFYENVASLMYSPTNDTKGNLANKNLERATEIVLNFYRGITTNDIPEQVAVSNLECLTRSSIFCEAFMDTKKFLDFFQRFKDTNNLEDPLFFNINCEVLLNVVNAISSKVLEGNQKMSD